MSNSGKPEPIAFLNEMSQPGKPESCLELFLLMLYVRIMLVPAANIPEDAIYRTGSDNSFLLHPEHLGLALLNTGDIGARKATNLPSGNS